MMVLNRRGIVASVLCAAAVAVTLASTFVAPLRDVYQRMVRELHPASPWQADIARRGVLRVAVRTRAMAVPAGMPAAEVPDSYDLAFARYLARHLGVPLEVLGVASADPARWLGARRVDVSLGGAASYLEGRGRLMVLPLAGQRPNQRHDLAAHSVCVDSSGPYRAVAERASGPDHVRAYPSVLLAISAFTANQCDALLDDEALLERVATLEAMKYYALTPTPVHGEGTMPVLLADASTGGSADVEALVQGWKRSGAARDATRQRAAELLIEVAQLQDGYACH